jgi:hypothetical protein
MFQFTVFTVLNITKTISYKYINAVHSKCKFFSLALLKVFLPKAGKYITQLNKNSLNWCIKNLIMLDCLECVPARNWQLCLTVLHVLTIPNVSLNMQKMILRDHTIVH